MKKLSLTVIALSLTALLAFFSPAFGQTTVVVPNVLENIGGFISLDIPFSCGESGLDSMRYQQVYLGSEFPQAGLIDKISFRLENIEPGFGPTILPGVLMELSTTQKQPDALSDTFADNVGPDVQTVFSGNLTLSAPECNTQPCPFDIMIPLQSPFFYDSQNGNLLFDIRIPVCGETPGFDGTPFAGIISRAYSTDADSPTASEILPQGLITQFRITQPPPTLPIATNIPTISEWGLIIIAGIFGIIGTVVIRRRKLEA